MKHTKEPWAWQKMGTHYYLVAQHGMREIIIGANADRTTKMPVPTMNDNGILYPIRPDHPNAQRIVDCVNALAGIDNPNEFIEACRNIISAREKAIKTEDLFDVLQAIEKAKKCLP